MGSPIIAVENLGKKYRLSHQAVPRRHDTLRDLIVEKTSRIFRPPTQPRANDRHNPIAKGDDFWALRDVSFEVKQGEVVGFIGRNGAGKSTLLKILSRITEPTMGRVRIRGRVASLLEVGTGFHPELTGRENIYLNGAILGMARVDIKRRFDEIVAFAEIDRFLDTPVKRYSSGMYVRLAFAVAAHLEPEILIVDEVLAVGDAEFQKKCLGRMGEVANSGRTVLFVSHNMGAVAELTQRVIYLENGSVKASGNTRDIIETYLRNGLKTQSKAASLSSYRRPSRRAHVVDIANIVLNEDDSDAFPSIEVGADFDIAIELNVESPIQGAVVSFSLKTSRGERVVLFYSGDQNTNLCFDVGRHTVVLRVKGIPLAPGTYFADAGINSSASTLAYDAILDFPFFEVQNTGQVTHWLDRPWGILHSESVEWCVYAETRSSLPVN